MVLLLEAVEPTDTLPDKRLQEFDEDGGTIGRSAANTWVLSDETVSGRHATIRFRDDVFFIEDTSMNGVFAGGDRLQLARPHPLHSGDELTIGPYVVRVSVISAGSEFDVDATRLQPSPGQEPSGAIAGAGRQVVGSPTLASVLAELGLSDVPVTAELARDIGRILRIVVAGLSDLLAARQHFKGEFRIDQTLFVREGNNPLKFNIDVEDALRNLLVEPRPGYLGAVDAFEDAFASLREHHPATLEAMRVAFAATLAEFAPDHLEERFDRTLGKRPRVGLVAKRKYWGLYRDLMDVLAKDPETTFRTLFGERFADVYAKEIDRP